MADGSVITACDLTPIMPLDGDDEAWLKELLRASDVAALTLGLSGAGDTEESPLAYFDGRSGQWCAGRFVGELRYQGRTLRILPRFGMPALSRWLSKIWGVRVLTSLGEEESGCIWLWELIARMWAGRLTLAGKHGLPRTRYEERYEGLAIKGRLLVRESALRLNTGRNILVSRTRNPHLDRRIGGILLGAYDCLRRELAHVGSEPRWLTERGADLIADLRTGLQAGNGRDGRQARTPVRYTPITEIYRPVVDMSQAIMRQNPFAASARGDRQVTGVLLDMAEIWELYVLHVLRDGLVDYEVVHTGREPTVERWLLESTLAGMPLGALKPDILVRQLGSDDVVAVIDAKYKMTIPGPGRPHGIEREDLYQMAAYLTAFHDAPAIAGILVYPRDGTSGTISRLQQRGHWCLKNGHDRRLSFVGIDCKAQVDASGAEEEALGVVRSRLT
jgi:5-methylcytosine-specific restriction enzyme subunit McrC